jgi:hypothetical protein
MSEPLEDPWQTTLKGPWTSKTERGQEPCHYCRRPAAMREPGRPWKAHKVCAMNTPSAGPLGEWDGEEHKPATGGSFGCGTPSASNAISCGQTGAKASCQLCPRSPTYWRKASR